MQISTTPQPAKKLIDASMPKNISAEDKAKLEAKWLEAARIRAEAIEKETKVPDTHSDVFHYQLRKYGRMWNAFYKKGVRFVPLLPTPSLKSSAIDAMLDKAEEEMLKA